MAGSRTCAQGHVWLADAGRADTPCPRCGQPALSEIEEPRTIVLRAKRDSDPAVSPTSFTGTSPAFPPVHPGWPDVPGYEIVGELGRGGMGIVYKARQTALQRTVAIKMIHLGPGGSADLVARLRAEAEALARLQHPNIIQVFEVGACPAGPYLVMEYASGGSLARRLDGAPQPPRLAARLVATLALAVQAAHERGIVHRDLKPGNVQLIEDESTPLEDCTLKVSDFGLARRLDEGSTLTLSGQVLGTPGYMPPEQARHSGDPVGPAADVYALGVLLYESLTGRPPFHGSTALETVHLMLSSEPLPPSRMRRQLPRDLETITLKCLHKEPSRRYAAAADLADDLARFLAGKPIRARPTPLWERLWMWARRQPGTAALVAGSLSLVAIGFCLVTWLWLRTEAAHTASLTDKARALELARAEAKSRREAQTLAARILLERGAALCEAGEHDAGLLWMMRGAEAVPPDDVVLQSSLRLLLGGWSRELHTLRYWRRLAGPVQAMAYSGDGKQVAIASGAAVTVVESASGEPAGGALTLAGHVLRLAPVGTGLAAVVRAGSSLRVVSVPSAKPLGPDIDAAARPRAAALSRDGLWLLVGYDDHQARLYRVPSGQLESVWPHKGPIHAVTFSPDGRLAVTGSKDTQARLWSVPEGKLQHELREHRNAVAAVAFSPDGDVIATGSEDRRVCLWDARTGELRRQFRAHEKDVVSIAFHPREPYLVTAGEDHSARVWDLETGQPVGAVIRHADEVHQVALSHGGDEIATAGEDGTARVWRLRRPALASTLLQGQRAVRSLAISRDGKALLSSGSDSSVRRWDLPAAASRDGVARSTVLKVAFAPDGKTFVAGLFNRTAQRYETASLRPVGEPWPHQTAVLAVACSPDGKLVATGCEDGDTVVRLRDARTGAVVRALPGHTRKVVSLAFSPDGTLLLSASWDHTARLWDVATGRPVGEPMRHLDLLQSAVFSPDGRLALTGGDDYMTRLWDVPTGEARGVPLRHPDKIQSVAFGPNGKLFATGSTLGRVRLWDAATSKPLGPPGVHAGEVHSLCFAPEGETLFSGGWDGAVKAWRVPQASGGGLAELRRWLETQTGQTLLDPGLLAPLTVGDWERRAREASRR